MTEQLDHYVRHFSQFEERAAGNGYTWLRSIRQEAISRFIEVGFPTTQDEDWRFTDLSPMARIPFELAYDGHFGLSPAPRSPQRWGARGELEPFTFPSLVCAQLVFVNGRYSPELSSFPPLPRGVKIGGLAQVLASDPDFFQEHLARYADFQGDAFIALNTAFMDDGGFAYIPRGVVLQEPIHILYVSTATPVPAITHPRNLIVADEDTQAVIVEQYISVGDDVHFSNAVTEVVAGPNSVLSHYCIERESPQAFNISTLRLQQGRSSSVTSHSVLLGGALVRNNVHPVLAGEGCDCLINGLFMPTGQQHMDNYMKVEHASPHGSSRQFYNGILDGQSRGVFHGRIIVHKGAQKTDAKQTNRNLLLSDECQIDTKPQLEIYADDVKCTHGATIGQLDEDALFYLRARGIPMASARALLLFAFASESLERMKVEPIRKYVEGLVTQWFR